MNNEAKVRRSTKSVVLEEAKVMSYEDIEEARAKRAAKEQAATGKGKRGWKRKSPAEEAGAPESAKSGADGRSIRASEGPSGANEQSARASEGPSSADERS